MTYKTIIRSLITALLVSTQALATDENLSIQYNDWDAVLKATVLDTGRSTRAVGKRDRSQPGTRLTKTNPRMTRNEGNRVFYHALGDDNRTYIRQLVTELAAIPTVAPIEDFPANEQLAYWLNLRNAAVYSMIADIYPETRLESFHEENWGRKWIKMGQQQLSVADIETYVMSKWDDPLVFYGFYQGHIGGPNLRRNAFTGNNVWSELKANAREFVRSLRGVQFRYGKLYVSKHYEDYQPVFTDLGVKLRTHLAEHAGPEMTQRIHSTEDVKADIEDWYIADLHNGHLGLTSSANTNTAGFVDALHRGGISSTQIAYLDDRMTVSVARFPPHVVQLLQRMVEDGRHLRTPNVSVEQIKENTGEK